MVAITYTQRRPDINFTRACEITTQDDLSQPQLDDRLIESFSTETIYDGLVSIYSGPTHIAGPRFTFWNSCGTGGQLMVFGGIMEDSPLLHAYNPSVGREELERKQLRGALNLLRNLGEF